MCIAHLVGLEHAAQKVDNTLRHPRDLCSKMNVDSLVQPAHTYTNGPLQWAISVFRRGVHLNGRSADADRLPRLTVCALAVLTKNPLWRAGLECVLSLAYSDMILNPSIRSKWRRLLVKRVK